MDRLQAETSVDFDKDNDAMVRAAAFDWLRDQVSIQGDVLPRSLLAEGFYIGQQRVPSVGPQGIFKPALIQAPLSITSAPSGPYDDAFGPGHLLRYRYRGTDPQHRDNLGLRFVMQRALPIIYFYGLSPGKYHALWPVYVVHDSPEALAFSIAFDDAIHLDLFGQSPVVEAVGARREYLTSQARRRLHQRAFRERVLRAYQDQCAFCRLRHAELLDAAHIIPDTEEGEPMVHNGISLCRLHHAAFDRFFIGVRPDYIVEVRADLLEESDGPTLQHAIQGLHNKPITLPRRDIEKPSVNFLAERYYCFVEVATVL